MDDVFYEDYTTAGSYLALQKASSVSKYQSQNFLYLWLYLYWILLNYVYREIV